jgi:ADP-ribose pyrophosphatase YjhB (NUDIX family)
MHKRRAVRAVATVLAERDGSLLLCQLARGPYAGFWLLPSAAVETGTVAETARTVLPLRTGYAGELTLAGVLEEPRLTALSLRFVFRAAQVAEQGPKADPEILQARWFTRAAVTEVLAERDVVPTLGVMALLRAWVDDTPLDALEVVVDDMQCPCGSGFSFKGCCGWDAK